MWLATETGGEQDNRASVRTDENGRYRIETAPTIAQFGEPNIHVGYDDGEYREVFIRRVVDLDDSPARVDLTLAPRWLIGGSSPPSRSACSRSRPRSRSPTRHLDTGPAALVVSTLAATLAVSALALQPFLAALSGRRLRWHRVLGTVTFALVLAHVGGLYIVSAQDTLFALSLDGPTRARMALMATIALAVVVVLGVGRARLPLSTTTWQVLHAFFAVLVVVLGVGHAVLTDGALDGAGTPVLLGSASPRSAGSPRGHPPRAAAPVRLATRHHKALSRRWSGYTPNADAAPPSPPLRRIFFIALPRASSSTSLSR